jgi:hypothetical protein
MTTAKDAQPSVSELRADIEQHRTELAATVDALAEKLDVKSKVQAKLLSLQPLLVPLGGGVALLAVVALVRKRRRS